MRQEEERQSQAVVKNAQDAPAGKPQFAYVKEELQRFHAPAGSSYKPVSAVRGCKAGVAVLILDSFAKTGDCSL
jgi:hypothetical protein